MNEAYEVRNERGETIAEEVVKGTRSGPHEVISNENFFGLVLHKCHTPKFVKFTGYRAVEEGDNQLWEILIEKEPKRASIYRDTELLAMLQGVSIRLHKLENMALAGVRHIILDNLHCEDRKKRKRERKALARQENIGSESVNKEAEENAEE